MVHLRTALRLRQNSAASTICAPVDVVRYQEIINGKTFLIEVLFVDPNRWRAQLVRRSDRATSVMPFYGTTAAEAADLLSRWLKKAAGLGVA